MKMNLKAVATLVLASAAVAQAQDAAAPARHHVRRVHEAKPTLQSEIESLRSSVAAQQAQIQALQQQLATSAAAMQQIQAQAQTVVAQAAAQAQSVAASQQAVVAQNTTTVNSLQNAVSDLQAKNQTLTATVAENQKKTMNAIDHPDELHIKGATLSPTGSFIEFATVNRTRATGSDIPTPFSSIPFSAADAGHLSEFEATARQSRIALLARTHVGETTLSGYYEADWLGAGVTSNNNQSNSYVLRERQLWAQAAFHNGITVTGGQQWSLATEDAKGIENRTEVLPQTIDPNYQVGFVWMRQPSFRVTYTLSPQITFGMSAEAAQTLTPSCTASSSSFPCAVNYLLGQSGTGGGLYNSTATYAYNLAPDLLAKIALDPSFGHFEVFGIERDFRNRVYGNINPQTGKVINANLTSGSLAFNDSMVAGGVGGSARFYLMQKRFNAGVKGEFGDGTGRYATSQLPDLTVRPDGQFAPLHNFSVMGFAEGNVTKRLNMYTYYGTDYVGHDVFTVGKYQVGYGSHLLATSGCGIEVAPGTSSVGYTPSSPSNCSVNNKDTREATAGFWYDFYKGPGGRFREGFQYSWVERNTYSGLNGISPTAVDNVFETSMRYYLP